MDREAVRRNAAAPRARTQSPSIPDRRRRAGGTRPSPPPHPQPPIRRSRLEDSSSNPSRRAPAPYRERTRGIPLPERTHSRSGGTPSAVRAPLRVPSVIAQQRHEPHRRERFAIECRSSSRDQEQLLLLFRPDRDEQSPALGELIEQRLRHVGARGANEDRVVRRVRLPAVRAVAEHERDVRHLAQLDRLSRVVEERLDPLDAEDLRRQVREQHGLIPRPRTDLEHALGALQRERLEISRVDRWLADRLRTADRQRRVFVRAMPNARRHEEMARREIQRAQHRHVAHALLAQLLDEPRTRALVLTAYGAFHQVSASSRRAWNVTSRCSGVTEMYPSRTAATSVPSSAVHVTDPPPIQKMGRPHGSFIFAIESENVRRPSFVSFTPLICATGMPGMFTLNSVCAGNAGSDVRCASSLVSGSTISSRSDSFAPIVSRPAKLTAIDGTPSASPSIAAATVPEYSTSSPMFGP